MKLINPSKVKVLAVLSIAIFSTSVVSAQSVLRGGVKAKFGVDGDVEADTCRSGPGASLSNKGLKSHDWFDFIYRTGATGVGIIDTTGAYAVLQAKMTSPSTTSFIRRLKYDQHSIVDSVMMIDAIYGADRAGSTDTVYDAGTVLGGPPTWTIKAGSSPGKSDIIDFASHIRRNGLTYQDSLWMYLGMSFGSTNGSKEGTMELFVDDVKTVGNSFTGYGSQAGRKAWRFNNAGEVIVAGDMMISWEYNAGGGGSFTVRPYIWMADSNRNTSNSAYHLPTNFNYVTTGTDYWATSGTYGFQQITPKSGASFAYGVASDFDPKSSPFGTATGNTGTFANKFADEQFIEFGMNLTALGVDPTNFEAINVNPCGVSFRTIIYRTMSANVFTSSMKDVAGPYPFWRSVFNANRLTDTLDCITTASTFEIPDTADIIFYNWSALPGTTTLGTENSDSSMTFTSGGKYLLEYATETCVTFVDTIEIFQDTITPIATVTISDTLIEGSVTSVVLYGGDVAATTTKMAATAATFGPSQGLTWAWTGVNGFDTTIQFPNAVDSGMYYLTVTELRNGCTASDSGFLVLLPVEFGPFHCAQVPNGIQLNWETISENDISHFNVQKWNGMMYENLGTVQAAGYSQSFRNYVFLDSRPTPGPNVYRIESVTRSTNAKNYSDPCVTTIKGRNNEHSFVFKVYPNPGEGEFTLYSALHASVTTPVFISDLSGRVVKNADVVFSDSGVGIVDLTGMKSGMYFIGIADPAYPVSTRITIK